MSYYDWVEKNFDRIYHEEINKILNDIEKISGENSHTIVLHALRNYFMLKNRESLEKEAIKEGKKWRSKLLTSPTDKKQ